MNRRYCVRIDKVRMCRTDKETEKLLCELQVFYSCVKSKGFQKILGEERVKFQKM